MKIAIVTLYGFFNYGNRLQNYALQNCIEKMGHKVETIAVEVKEPCLKKFAKKYLEKKEGYICVKKKAERIRSRNFHVFNENYIKTRILRQNDMLIPKDIAYQYDHFIVGSDQVWNPLFWEKGERSTDLYNFMLKFAPKQKRIAYAASFGIDKLPCEWENLFADALNEFHKISVREEEGKKIVTSLSHKDVSVVLDPTMLLHADEWRKIERKEILPKKEKYLLTYFLGEQSEEVKKKIERIGLKNNCRIINLMDSNETKFYEVGPEGFVTLIDYAEAIYTDSFHATVFSILFQKPFVVLSRKHKNQSDMNSRLSTLLKSFNLEKCMSDSIEDNLPYCDYDLCERLLEIKREESLAYLRDAF